MNTIRLGIVLMLFLRGAALSDAAPASTCPIPGLWHGECRFQDSVTIGPEDTVIISSGTTVEFSGPRASFNVAGSLFALGFADDSIALIARDVSPDFAWNFGGVSLILYSVLDGSPNGIRVQDGSLAMGYAQLTPVPGSKATILARNATLRFECFSPDTLVKSGSVQMESRPCQDPPDYSPAHWRSSLSHLAETYRHHPDIGQNHLSAIIGFRGIAPEELVEERLHGDSLRSLAHNKLRLAGTWYAHPDFAIRSSMEVWEYHSINGKSFLRMGATTGEALYFPTSWLSASIGLNFAPGKNLSADSLLLFPRWLEGFVFRDPDRLLADEIGAHMALSATHPVYGLTLGLGFNYRSTLSQDRGTAYDPTDIISISIGYMGDLGGHARPLDILADMNLTLQAFTPEMYRQAKLYRPGNVITLDASLQRAASFRWIYGCAGFFTYRQSPYLYRADFTDLDFFSKPSYAYGIGIRAERRWLTIHDHTLEIPVSAEASRDAPDPHEEKPWWLFSTGIRPTLLVGPIAYGIGLKGIFFEAFYRKNSPSVEESEYNEIYAWEAEFHARYQF